MADQHPLDDLAAKPGILVAHRHAGGAADCRPGLAGDRQPLPGGGRRLGLRADDLDLVAILQIGHQRRMAAIDAAADAAVADVGVDGIGEVDGVGTLRQGDELALGGEAEDLVGEQLELGMLEEFLGIVAFREDVDEAAEPAIRI